MSDYTKQLLRILQYLLLMKKMLQLTCLLSLVWFSISNCDSKCLTCTGPNDSLCTSCPQNYFPLGSDCFICNTCANYASKCSLCYPQDTIGPQKSSGASPQIIGIIFGVIGGLFVISIFGIIFYKRCAKPIDPPVPANLGSSELLQIPQQLKWAKGDERLNQTEPCPICLEPGTLLKTHCQHMYHPECISAWVTKKQLSCPLCKSTNLEPIQVYCPQCQVNYIQASLYSISEIQNSSEWKCCEACAEKSP